MTTEERKQAERKGYIAALRWVKSNTENIRTRALVTRHLRGLCDREPNEISVTEPEPQKTTSFKIMEAAKTFYKIPIIRSTNEATIVRLRLSIAYLLVNHTDMNYTDIGNLIGRDHSTVSHYLKMAQNLAPKDMAKWRCELDAIIAIIKGGTI